MCFSRFYHNIRIYSDIRSNSRQLAEFSLTLKSVQNNRLIYVIEALKCNFHPDFWHIKTERPTDRPTKQQTDHQHNIQQNNQQTDMRVHREVTLQRFIKVKNGGRPVVCPLNPSRCRDPLKNHLYDAVS